MIDVVLPVLDGADAIPRVLEPMPDGYRPIVVDNGSTDGSAAIATSHGAHVVLEPHRGFGAACYAGLLAATAPIVCFMDCDGSLERPACFARPLHAGDFVVDHIVDRAHSQLRQV